jgi:hypothetical protein
MYLENKIWAYNLCLDLFKHAFTLLLGDSKMVSRMQSMVIG